MPWRHLILKDGAIVYPAWGMKEQGPGLPDADTVAAAPPPSPVPFVFTTALLAAALGEASP